MIDKKVILKMLLYLSQKFEGGMRVNKYMSFTKSKRLIDGTNNIQFLTLVSLYF